MQAAGSSLDRASCIMTTRSGRKHTSVVTQTRGEAADMGDTAESIACSNARTFQKEKKPRGGAGAARARRREEND